MKTYGRADARQRMNELGDARRPFLFVVSYDGSTACVEELSQVPADECLYDFRGVENAGGLTPRVTTSPSWTVHQPEKEAYCRSFDIVRQSLLRGDSYLVNLTARVPIDTNIGLRDIFLRAKAPYRLWLKDRLVCFSPETFVRIADGTIRTFPMKGTLSALLPDAEQTLLDDHKEQAEHATIVDLLRNDLSMVASGVHVERYRYVERVETNRGPLLQTSSEIVGTVADDWHRRVGDLLFTLLPAGSITGAPKRQTMDIIGRAETHRRGFYTGVMGCFDGHRLDSAVMIRYIEQEADGRLAFKAGGGITARSRWQREYDEIIEKTYVPIR